MARSLATKTGPRQIASMEMTLRILAKRAAFQPLKVIADSEGISVQAVATRIKKALKQAPVEGVELLRRVQSDQIEYALRAISDRVGRGELPAIDRWFHGLERMARLHGLDLTPEFNVFPILPEATLAMFAQLAEPIDGESRVIEEEESGLQGQESATGSYAEAHGEEAEGYNE